MGIDNHLKVIKEGVFGRDVRQAIHDGIQQVYDDATANGNANMEVAKARGYASTLVERLDQMEQTDKATAQDISVVSGQIGNLIANAGNGTVPSELTDMRVAFDGKKYSTAGEAVREQLKQKADLTPGVNLLDSSTAETGFYVAFDSGGKSPNAEYQINHIQVTAGTRYYLNFANNVHVAFFDSSKRYISGLVNPTNFVAPSNAKEMSVSYFKSQASRITLSLTPVREPQPFVTGLNGQEILDSSIALDKLETEAKDLINNKADLTPGVNLLDSSTAETGFYVAFDSGGKSPNAEYQINHIQVTAGTRYYLNFANNVHVAFFDSSKRYISGLINPTNFVAPSNAKEMSVSYFKSQADVIAVSLKAVKEPVSPNKGIDGQTILYASVGLHQLDDEVRNSLGSDKKIITVGPTGEYQSLVRAIKDNPRTINTYKLVNYTNNLYDDYIDYYGPDYFNQYRGYFTTSDPLARGINLKPGDSLIGDAKSVIKFDYDKSNQKVNEFFAPVNLTINNTVDNVRFKIGDGTCRYIIHDDFAGSDNGTNIISNCIFEGRSYLDTAIGGGMATNSTYIIDTCVFRSAGVLAVTYHSNAADNTLNKYIVKNCYCSPGSSIRGSWYGPSTGLTPMIVTGCTADSITCVSVGNVQNMELIEYNNVIRNKEA